MDSKKDFGVSEQKNIDLGEKATKIEEREKKKIEASLREERRMGAIGLLAGGIAHDFNNIISIIVANIELVMNNLPNDDPKRNRLKNAIDASFRASELLAQLITFSHSKEKESLNLNDTIFLHYIHIFYMFR